MQRGFPARHLHLLESHDAALPVMLLLVYAGVFPEAAQEVPAAVLAVPADAAEGLAHRSRAGQGGGDEEADAFLDASEVVEASHEVAVVDEQHVLHLQRLDAIDVVQVVDGV